jgi:hypothetical protein
MRTRFKRTLALGLLLGMALFLVLAIQSQAGPVPPLPAEPDLSRLPQAVAVPAAGRAPSLPQGAVPCTPGNCTDAVETFCNRVENWSNDDILQWTDYKCLDTSIFPSVPYSETLYTLSIVSDSLDFGLAIPLATEKMNNFGAVLNSCESDDCPTATHVKDLRIHQHAIVPDAPKKEYILSIDSPNMVGRGDAIVSCGSHDTGWCDDQGVVSATLPCGDSSYTLLDNTDNGLDNIIYYNTNFAYDGPELTYKVVLTKTQYVTATLHYTGNRALVYFNYMSFFLLDNTCDQRSKVLYSGLTGETMEHPTATASARLLAGTYYLVVDGIHMPRGGDAFRLDLVCTAPDLVYLPIVLRNH